jgi:hypothetical protein
MRRQTKFVIVKLAFYGDDWYAWYKRRDSALVWRV